MSDADIVEQDPDAVKEVNKKMKISRGVRQETEVDELDLVSIGNQIVFDENGNKIKFGDVYKKQKTIIVFTRHLLCFMCKEYVEDLAVVPLEYLQDADVRIVVICPAPHKFIKPFRIVTGYNYSMYSDPDRNIYKAFGFKEKLTSTTLSKSKHVKSGFIMGVLSSTWRAMKVQEYQGDVKQQGGSLIIGPGNIINYSHLDQNPTDHMAINDLLQISGVQTVSFPRDPRVIQV